MPLHIHTPLLESRALSLAAERPVLLKMDALQPPGSFKIRGVGAACEHHVAQGKQRSFLLPVAMPVWPWPMPDESFPCPVTVYVPETTTEQAKALIRLEGAEVVVHGASWQEANELALQAMGAGCCLYPSLR